MRMAHRLAIVTLLVALCVVLLPGATIGAQVPIKIMALGDSITVGITAGVPDSQAVGYRLALAQRLASAGYSVDFVGSLAAGTMPDPEHEGHPGFRIGYLDARLDDWLPARPADIVLVMAGTNDAAQGLPGGAWRMAALVDHIAVLLPDAVILVSTIPPINPNGGGGTVASAELAARFNADLPVAIANRQAAGRNVRLVNVGGALDVSHLDVGGIHPNTAGYGRMADLWYAELTPYLASVIAMQAE
jgi:lysophospholipase L1-like esterase